MELRRGPGDPAGVASLEALSEAVDLPLVAGRRVFQNTLTAIPLGVSVAGAGHTLSDPTASATYDRSRS